MTKPKTSTTPKEFYNAFPVSADGGADVSGIYVNRFENDSLDIIQKIKQNILFEDGTACYLFTGLRGAGKTTELNKLKSELTAQHIPVFYIDASNYLDLNNPKLTRSDIVFTVLAGLGDTINKTFNKDGLKVSVWERFKAVLKTDVELKTKFKLPGTDTGVEFSLVENIAFRQELNKFASQSGNFYEESQRLFAELKAIVQEASGQNQMVVMVDSLERLSAPQGSEDELFNSLKDVFYNSPADLYFLESVVIYTVPPYLHALLPNVDSHYSKTYSLSNFKVMQTPAQDQDIQVNSQGLEKMQSVADKRFPQWQEFLNSQVLQHFAWLSGGNVRRFFSLLRNFISTASLQNAEFPIENIDDKSVANAVSEELRPLQWLNAQDRRWLKLCLESRGDLAKNIEKLDEDLPSVIRLFDHSLILNYENGALWHQVPPLVHGKIDS